MANPIQHFTVTVLPAGGYIVQVNYVVEQADPDPDVSKIAGRKLTSGTTKTQLDTFINTRLQPFVDNLESTTV